MVISRRGKLIPIKVQVHWKAAVDAGPLVRAYNWNSVFIVHYQSLIAHEALGGLNRVHPNISASSRPVGAAPPPNPMKHKYEHSSYGKLQHQARAHQPCFAASQMHLSVCQLFGVTISSSAPGVTMVHKTILTRRLTTAQIQALSPVNWSQ